VFNNRALALQNLNRRQETAMYLREAARFGELAGDSYRHAFALGNLADILCADDPAAAAAAAREGVRIARRTGGTMALAVSTQGLAAALLELGDWDAAVATVNEAIENDGIGDNQFIAYIGARVASTRGDVEAAYAMRERMGHMLTSEDPQDRAYTAIVDALIALVERRTDTVLNKAKEALAYWEAIGLGSDSTRWGWSLAARAAHELGDDAEVDALLTEFEVFQRGELPPMVHAELPLARARRVGRKGDPDARGQFDRAVAELRVRSTPFHLAHGLLDYADFLAGTGDSDSAAALMDEAKQIGERLGGEPLVRRATDVAGVMSDRVTAANE
jgi:tetratricopeptide (TPR) repeat protein